MTVWHASTIYTTTTTTTTPTNTIITHKNTILTAIYYFQGKAGLAGFPFDERPHGTGQSSPHLLWHNVWMVTQKFPHLANKCWLARLCLYEQVINL